MNKKKYNKCDDHKAVTEYFRCHSHCGHTHRQWTLNKLAKSLGNTKTI